MLHLCVVNVLLMYCMCVVSILFAVIIRLCNTVQVVSVLCINHIPTYFDVVITCPANVVSHGALVPSGPVPVNQTATVQCDDGYKLTGSPTVKCVLGVGQTTANWNGTFSSCQSECT